MQLAEGAILTYHSYCTKLEDVNPNLSFCKFRKYRLTSSFLERLWCFVASNCGCRWSLRLWACDTRNRCVSDIALNGTDNSPILLWMVLGWWMTSFQLPGFLFGLLSFSLLQALSIHYSLWNVIRYSFKQMFLFTVSARDHDFLRTLIVINCLNFKYRS